MAFLPFRLPTRAISVVAAAASAAAVSALVATPAPEPLAPEPAALAPAVEAATAGMEALPVVGRWAATWGHAPYLSFKSVSDKTLRMVVRTSVGGDQVRIHLSNRFGDDPLEIGGVSVGLQGTGASVAAGTLRQLTFSGSAQTIVPEGADIVSDPVSLAVPSLGSVTVSVYLPDASTGSEHGVGDGVAFTSTPGNHVTETAATSFATTRDNYMFLSGVDVTHQGARTIVAFGDSITDGDSARDARYPSVLAMRLQANPKYARFGVVNAGIGASELLDRAALFGLSEPGITRMDDDVLLQPTVSTVVIMMGTNDILGAHAATGEEVIAGLKQFTAKAHAEGIRVMGATITPCECYDDAKNAEREEVNAWVRTTDVLDATVDFDAALRDPANPRSMLPAYDSGDGLHPGAAGYQAMANAINLRALTAYP